MKQFIIAGFLIAISLPVAAIPYPSVSRTLKNGLKVIVCEKADNDFVEFEVWYRTGSKDERPGIRGMAHLFEHMMFGGRQNTRGNLYSKV